MQIECSVDALHDAVDRGLRAGERRRGPQDGYDILKHCAAVAILEGRKAVQQCDDVIFLAGAGLTFREGSRAYVADPVGPVARREHRDVVSRQPELQ